MTWQAKHSVCLLKVEVYGSFQRLLFSKLNSKKLIFFILVILFTCTRLISTDGAMVSTNFFYDTKVKAK